MTDPDLIAKKLAFIETCVMQLRTLARPALLATDVREERFVENHLDDLLAFVRVVRAKLPAAP
jgi:hypothetical protein